MDNMSAGMFSREYSDFTIKDNIIMGNVSKEEKKISVARRTFESLSDYPDFVGMINAKSGKKTTFEEMKNCSVRCALWLLKQGIGKNDVVCTSTYIQDYDYVPCFATFFVNATFNPWAHDVNAETAERFFATCRPKIMFACSKSIDLLSNLAKSLNLDCKFVSYETHPTFPTLHEITSSQSQQEVDNFNPIEPTEPNNETGLILFSSGTTGIPKATLLSYTALTSTHACEVALSAGSRCLWYSYMSWITGIKLAITCAWMRCVRIIHRDFDIEETSQVVEKYKVNWILWKPYLLSLCCQENIFARYDYSKVATIAIGGSKAHKSVLEECRKVLPHTFIMSAYGMTELGSVATRQTRNCSKIDSIGFVVKGVNLKIIGLSTKRALGPNQEGEICVKSDSVMTGYLDNPEETKAILDDEGWLHSGDLGYYDENGEIVITNRIKELIRTKSFTVAPSEVEANLVQHPSVFECAVVAVDHPIDIQRPIAFVIKTSEATVTKEELIEFSASKNEKHRLTGGVVFVDEIPFNSSGKKCLKTLKEMAKAHGYQS